MFLEFHDRRQKGFTLVELIIVLAILGILVMLALSRLNYSRAKAAERACNSKMGEIKKAAEMYFLDTGSTFPDIPVNASCILVTQNYLKGTPQPHLNNANYKVNVDSTETAQVTCGDNATKFGRGPLGHQ